VGVARNSRSGAGPALTQRLLRWLQPPRRLRPTRAGWIFCGLTFGVGFAALNTGNNLLYLVLSLMLAFLVLSGVMSESALRGIRVRRRLPRDLFAGASSGVGLEIANEQPRVPAFAVVVEDRVREADGVERAAGRAFALRIDPGTAEVRSYQFTPSSRGKLNFIEFRVYTRFPFGLFSKSLRVSAAAEALAYPEVESVTIPSHFGEACEGGQQLAGRGSSGVNAVGLREFAAGDSMRRLHWRSSLRHRKLLVTEIENEHQAEIEVRLTTRGIKAGEPFETRISWAASEIVALIDSEKRVSLRTESRRFEADSGQRHRARLLTHLALIQPGAESGMESS